MNGDLKEKVLADNSPLPAGRQALEGAGVSAHQRREGLGLTIDD